MLASEVAFGELVRYSTCIDFSLFRCRVKLAYNVKTGEAVAVKIIDTNGEKAAVWDDVRKEVALTSNGVLTYKLVTQWYRPACRYIIPYRYCICFFYRPADRYYIYVFYRPAYRYIISYRYCICVFLCMYRSVIILCRKFRSPCPGKNI